MQKAFLFDMDGVLIDSESLWAPMEAEALPRLFGKEIAAKVGGTLGLSLHAFYDSAVALGATISREEFLAAYDSEAARVYRDAPLSAGLEQLAAHLHEHDFKIGLISMSPQPWIDLTLAKMPFRDRFEVVISLSNNPILRPKPFPDGYKKAMEILDAHAGTTMILEDSNTGLKAAKDSGAFVVGYREHLPHGYEQIEADAYADSMNDVVSLVDKFEVNLLHSN